MSTGDASKSVIHAPLTIFPTEFSKISFEYVIKINWQIKNIIKF